jgi:Na+/H+ antiporter NhaD/arsenite permease-like protein
MTPGSDMATTVVFGLDPQWFAAVVFILTYVVIMTDRINRAIVALTAAGLMIFGGVLTQEAALRGVDFNTLGLLTGMMVIVAITSKSGIFQYLAIWSAKRVNGRPWGILVMLTLVTAILSALLDNVTTVLLIAPVTLLITEELEVPPYPFLFSEIIASNIGGTATLIGDPPNIMIGSAVRLTFNDFLWNLAPVVPLILVASMVPIYLIWGRRLHTSEANRRRVMDFDEGKAITDPRLLRQALAVLALVIIGFVLSHSIGQEPASIAMFGAAVLLLVTNIGVKAEEQTRRVHSAFSQVEWVTLFFFMGLFVVVHAVDSTGLLRLLAEEVVSLTGGAPQTTAMAILWVSALASAVVDNIPFVATMIPIIKSMATTFGGHEGLLPLWWSLALGACLGGNGTLVGASANLVVAGFAERAGHPIRFVPFMLMAFPLMIFSILISTAYLYLRYF